MTFAQVMDAMQKAGSLDALNEAAANIELVPDAGQREELKAAYDKLAGKMEV